MDELITGNQYFRVYLTKVPLNLDKNIYLVRAFEIDYDLNKKYLRTALILVNDEIVTSTFTDSIHFMEELNLYDFGNSQNKYLDVTEYQNTKNLRLKLHSETIYLSKSECKAIYRLFNLSFPGYSMTRVLEFEYHFTPQILTEALFTNGYLDLKR